MVFAIVSTMQDRAKVDRFVNRPVAEHEQLIAISKKFHAEKFKTSESGMTYSTDPTRVSVGQAEELLPDEFTNFGFDEVSLKESKLIGHLYYSFDSGGDAVIDWSNQSEPTITVVEGDYGDIITKVYPKEK